MAEPAPLVIISSPLVERWRRILESEGYRTGSAWQLSDAERAETRAILHAGEFVLTKAFLLSLPNLSLIACLSAGFDGIDVGWCRTNGIEVTHAQNGNAEEVADFALGLILASSRGIVAGDRLIRDGGWIDQRRVPVFRGLAGCKAGIVGLGYIGSAIARRLDSLNMIVSWSGPSEKPDSRWPRVSDLLQLAQNSDILIIACRATAENRGLVSREIIEAVGPAGLIVNISRGSMIDEASLIECLQTGKLGGAALDVFEDEPTPAARWAGVPNTVLTPHAAGATRESLQRMTDLALENLRLHVAGMPVLSPAKA